MCMMCGSVCVNYVSFSTTVSKRERRREAACYNWLCGGFLSVENVIPRDVAVFLMAKCF